MKRLLDKCLQFGFQLLSWTRFSIQLVSRVTLYGGMVEWWNDGMMEWNGGTADLITEDTEYSKTRKI